MVNKDRLKAVARENGYKFTDLADILGLKYTTFMQRLYRGYLRSNDIEALIAVLGLTATEYEPVFFDRLHNARNIDKAV